MQEYVTYVRNTGFPFDNNFQDIHNCDKSPVMLEEFPEAIQYLTYSCKIPAKNG